MKALAHNEAGVGQGTDKPERVTWGCTLVEKTDKEHPRVTIATKDGKTRLSVKHPDGSDGVNKLMEQIGTKDAEFFNYLMETLILGTARKGVGADEEQVNFILSVIKGIQPKDQIEIMLAAQMAMVHRLSACYAFRVLNGGALAERDHAERTLNKLTRTFVSQMEGLKRYRSNAAQRVEVHHHHHHHQQNVRIEDGARAVVAQQLLAGGGPAGDDAENRGQPHAKLTHAPGETLPGNVQALRPSMSRAGRKRA